MAKFAAKAINFSLNSVAIEDDLDNVSLSVTQEVPATTSFADAGPRRVAGQYDWGIEGSGAADFAAGQSDATLFAMLGSNGVASALDPTGNSAGTNDPNYDGTVLLESYRISGQVGGRVDMQFSTKGNSALTRAVA